MLLKPSASSWNHRAPLPVIRLNKVPAWMVNLLGKSTVFENVSSFFPVNRGIFYVFMEFTKWRLFFLLNVGYNFF